MDDAPSRWSTFDLRIRDWMLGTVVVAAALISQLLARAGSVNFDATSVSDATLIRNPQLLPLRLLRQNLVDNLAHLHIQPPLFNLATAGLIRLDPASRADWVSAFNIGMACLLAASAYFLLRELEINRWIALGVVGLFVIANPLVFFEATQYSLVLPSATIITTMAWLGARWIRTSALWPGLVYGLLGAILILSNDFFQVYLVAIATLALVASLGHRWRQAILSLLVPTLLVGTWYLNDLFQFNDLTTASAIGQTLANTTVSSDSVSDISQLITSSQLSRLSAIPPASCLSSFGSLGFTHRTKVITLDLKRKSGCYSAATAHCCPNYNAKAYLDISRRYTSDDLKWIQKRPGRFIANLGHGLIAWNIPYLEPTITDASQWHMGDYAAFYEHMFGLQPSSALAPGITVNAAPSPSSISFTMLIEAIASLVLLPLVLRWKRRFLTRAQRGIAWWMWMFSVGALLTTMVFGDGTGSLWRDELGAIPLASAVIAIAWLFKRTEEMKPLDVDDRFFMRE